MSYDSVIKAKANFKKDKERKKKHKKKRARVFQPPTWDDVDVSVLNQIGEKRGYYKPVQKTTQSTVKLNPMTGSTKLKIRVKRAHQLSPNEPEDISAPCPKKVKLSSPRRLTMEKCKVSKPPVSSLKPVECKMQLPEYVATLPVNFHTKEVEILKKHIRGRDRDLNYQPKVLLITGHPGCGKTFCVTRACEEAGFELVYVDMMHADLDDHLHEAVLGRSDPFGPFGRNKIRVAVIDAMEGLETSYLTKVGSFLHHITDPYNCARGKAKKKIAFKFHCNLIVITTSNRYNKRISSWMYKLKPTEIKINSINYAQGLALAREACKYQGVPMEPKVHKLVAAHLQDLTSMLMKLQFLVYGEGVMEHSSICNDDRDADIFTCCRTLLEPPEDPETEETLTFDNYQRMWVRGGSRVFQVLHNSYPGYVRYIPELPKKVQRLLQKHHSTPNGLSEEEKQKKCQWIYESLELPHPGSALSKDEAVTFRRQKIQESTDYMVGGLSSLAELAETFSFCGGIWTDELKLELLQRTLRAELSDINVRADRKRKIDVKTREPQQKGVTALVKCNVNQHTREVFHAVRTMQRIESAKKLHNFNYQLNTEYDLSGHVGYYFSKLDDTNKNIYVKMDMFPEHKDKPETRKKSMPRTHPRLQCINLFSHTYGQPCTLSAEALSMVDSHVTKDHNDTSHDTSPTEEQDADDEDVAVPVLPEPETKKRSTFRIKLPSGKYLTKKY